MPVIKGNQRHHCARKGEGNCREHKSENWCIEHNHACYKNNWYYTIGSPCMQCNAAKSAQHNAERIKLKNEKKSAEIAREVAERKAAKVKAQEQNDGPSTATRSRQKEKRTWTSSKTEHDGIRKDRTKPGRAEMAAQALEKVENADKLRKAVINTFVTSLKDHTTSDERSEILQQVMQFEMSWIGGD